MLKAKKSDSISQHHNSNAATELESRYLSSYEVASNFGVVKSIMNKTNSYVCGSGSSDESESNRNGLNNSFNVKFSGFVKTEKIDEREKYLTAKYPNHQMALIKKRLKVEFWIDDQLKNLYNINDENTKEDYDICPDDLVDTLLDMDTDNERRSYVVKKLANAKKPKDIVSLFVDELLVKLRSL